MMADGGRAPTTQPVGPMIERRDEYRRQLLKLDHGDRKKRRIERLLKGITSDIETIQNGTAHDPDWEEKYPRVYVKPGTPATRGPHTTAEDERSGTGDHGDVTDARQTLHEQSRAGPVSAPPEPTRPALRFICKAFAEKEELPHIKSARVLFLVNVDFDYGSQRHEALEDYNKLHTVFIEKLGYENFLVNALKYKTEYGLSESKPLAGISDFQAGEYSWRKDQMLEIITSFAKTEFSGDALILFVNSHGNRKDNRDVVYGTDCKPGKDHKPLFVDEIIEIFEKHSHSSVKKLSKLVFVQACRGMKPVPLSTIKVEGGGDAEEPSTQDVVHDPLSNLDQLTLEEQSPRTQGTGFSETNTSEEPGSDDIPNVAMPDLPGSEDSRVLSGESHANSSGASSSLLPNQLHLNESQGAIPKTGHSSQRPPAMPWYGSGEDTASPTRQRDQRNVSNPPAQSETTNSLSLQSYVTLPNTPKNFLIVCSTPNDCLSGRIRTENNDPIIDEGCIFSQIFAMHLKACLDQVGTSNQGVALLPLLTGVQNEISRQWHEIGVISHTLTRQPVLNRNTDSPNRDTQMGEPH